MPIKFNILNEENNYDIEESITSFLNEIDLIDFKEEDIIIEFWEGEKEVTDEWKNNKTKKPTYELILKSLKDIVEKQKNSTIAFKQKIDDLFFEIDEIVDKKGDN